MLPLLDPQAKLVIAHRGNSAYFPENTLPAFTSAVELGVDALEFDLRITRDGVAVVHHDATLDRTTTGTGPLAARTLAELKTLDAGARFTRNGTNPYAGQAITIPTFEEVLEAFPITPFIIELKVPEVAAETRRLLEKHHATGRVIVDSFAPGALDPLRGSDIALGASSTGAYRMLRHLLTGPPKPGTLNFKALCIPWTYRGFPIPCGAIARSAKHAAVVTHVWTVDTPRLAATLWAGGVNGIVTNEPRKIMLAREQLMDGRSPTRG
ncbi:MAG: glycerophosphodiester phosphodiesterase family protein [Gemmatimonadaceae bacterium]